ncbi:MAG: radical SAM protein [Actinobacteria bacterium]|nr:radical SAM protein [Actinomycetota bacterium]
METLGCPKNQVDSDKLEGVLCAEGMSPAPSPEEADLIVVNTCAFVEAAREESIECILELAEARKPETRLVVTGCLAERYGSELAQAMPEIDVVASFDRPLGSSSMDLLRLPRPRSNRPWAYVKIAEGCDRHCHFCAIPSFRGRQRSVPMESILEEVRALDVTEVVLVAQDTLSWGHDRRDRTPLGSTPLGSTPLGSTPLGSLGFPTSNSPTSNSLRVPPANMGRKSKRPGIADLLRAVSSMTTRTRLLYLYPSSLGEETIEAILETGIPYFDLSFQHVAKPLLERMGRSGDGDRFVDLIDRIRSMEPSAVFRASFILGYPGETEEDHDLLMDFLRSVQLDWAGFFPYSAEEGTRAAALTDQVPPELIRERINECSQLQDRITAAKRYDLIGEKVEVLVDSPGEGRSYREAPEIDGVIYVPRWMSPGSIYEMVVTDAIGPDLEAHPLNVPYSKDSNVLNSNVLNRKSIDKQENCHYESLVHNKPNGRIVYPPAGGYTPAGVRTDVH